LSAEVELKAKKIADATPELQLLAGTPLYETNPSRGRKKGRYGSCAYSFSLSLLDLLEEPARPPHQVLNLAAFLDGIPCVQAVAEGVRVARERTGCGPAAVHPTPHPAPDRRRSARRSRPRPRPAA
jgi:hypothetical protein